MAKKIRITDQNDTRPGGLLGTERISVEDIRQDRLYDASLQDIADLTPTSTFTLTDGSGTTANDTAVDFGGSMSGHAILDNQATYHFRIQNPYDSNTFQINDDSVYSFFESGTLSNTISLDHNSYNIELNDSSSGHDIYEDYSVSGSVANWYRDVTDGSITYSFKMHSSNGVEFTIPATGTYKLVGIKTGSTQGNAGAVANELWVTNGHATLDDNIVMMGV